MDEPGANSGLLSSASAAIPPGREAGVKCVGIVCEHDFNEGFEEAERSM